MAQPISQALNLAEVEYSLNLYGFSVKAAYALDS